MGAAPKEDKEASWPCTPEQKEHSHHHAMKDDDYGLHCVPHTSTSCVEALSPSTSECDCSGERIFKEVTNVKRGRTGGHRGPLTPSPREDAAGGHVRTEAEMAAMLPEAKGRQGLPEAGGGKGGFSPGLRASAALPRRRPRPPASATVGTCFGCLKSPSSWCSGRAALGSQGTRHCRGQGFCT